MSNSDKLKGQWKQIKGDLRERWGKLTNDEVEQIDGQEQNLVGKIQEKYGIAKEEAQSQVNNFLSKLNSTVE
nr:CsbD family protein [Oceanococcus sp. HetDA_MAG_MS8]